MILVLSVLDLFHFILDFIDLALFEDSMQKRIERINEAAKNTWQNRVEMFWNVIEAQSAGDAVPVPDFAVHQFS